MSRRVYVDVLRECQEVYGHEVVVLDDAHHTVFAHDGSGLHLWHLDARDHMSCCATFVPFVGLGKRWLVVQEEPLTIEPNIVCARCGEYGRIYGGKWLCKSERAH